MLVIYNLGVFFKFIVVLVHSNFYKPKFKDCILGLRMFFSYKTKIVILKPRIVIDKPRIMSYDPRFIV